MPRAEVKLPSDAPPVEASSSCVWVMGSKSEPSSAAKDLSAAEEFDGAAGALHGRAVDATFERQGAAGVAGGLERGKFALEARAVRGANCADVDFGPGFGGDDVGFGTAADDSGVDGDAALEIGEGAYTLKLTGQLEDGGAAAGEVDSGVGGDAVDGQTPVAGAFAGGLVGEHLRRFEDVDGGALAGEGFGDGA